MSKEKRLKVESRNSEKPEESINMDSLSKKSLLKWVFNYFISLI